MASIFLDANCFIDLVEQKNPKLIQFLDAHSLTISVLSIHILIYIYKYRIPNKSLARLKERFAIAPISTPNGIKALAGPTTDYEDNLQLLAATDIGCSHFVTNDKKLLKLKQFHNMVVLSSQAIQKQFPT